MPADPLSLPRKPGLLIKNGSSIVSLATSPQAAETVSLSLTVFSFHPYNSFPYDE